MNFNIKSKFGLNLERDKIISLKKMELNWIKITNISIKLNIKH